MRRVFRREIMVLVIAFLVLIACTAAVVEPKEYELLPEDVIGTVTLTLCDGTYQFNISDTIEDGVRTLKYSGIHADRSDPDTLELSGQEWAIDYQLDPEEDYALPDASFDFDVPISAVNTTAQPAMTLAGHWTWDPRNPNLATMSATLMSGDSILGGGTVCVNVFTEDLPWGIIFAQSCAALYNALEPIDCSVIEYGTPYRRLRQHVGSPTPPRNEETAEVPDPCM